MGRMANRAAASIRSSSQRVRDAVTARRVLAYVLMPLLLLCAFASLIALNLLLRDLWGELAYAILVTGVALWALSQTQDGAWLCMANPRPEEPLPKLEDCGDEVDPDTER
jgi:hypothetical protein